MYVCRPFPTTIVLTHSVELVTFIEAVGYVVAPRRIRIAHRCAIALPRPVLYWGDPGLQLRDVQNQSCSQAQDREQLWLSRGKNSRHPRESQPFD